MAKEIGRYDQFPKTGQTSSTLALFGRSGIHIKPTSRMAARRPSKSFIGTPKHPRKHHATLDQTSNKSSAAPAPRRSGQLHQHPGDQADLSSHQPSIFGSNYTKCFEEVSTDIYSRPKPYSPSRQLRDMSGKLLDHGYIQKLSRYKIIQDSLVKAQIKLMASSHGAIKAIDSKHFISIYFLSLVHFQTVRESLVEPINLLSLCEATPKHLDLSRLLSIESCGVLNPPSFHSNSFAKLESDTHPASKAPSQSTSIIN
ncbi:hypothetical protein DY000_02053720 [Brassica cretica]|uniref:Uncharacterized protein n=1 Tax=Brassica cretica TaxID=69181 RepID=A0ABQ7A5E5_BRACR|nr:hypothetical protein DY000_02053720 [Brassica cretica]